MTITDAARHSHLWPASALTTEDQRCWQPLIFDRSSAEHRAHIAELFAQQRVWQVHDTIEEQLRDLAQARAVGQLRDEAQVAEQVQALVGDMPLADYGRWIYYPWSGLLVHLLPEDQFHELRLDRNRNKITRREQELLQQQTVGIVGLSVGNAVALTLALEGVCGTLKLADFDTLGLSNMNRVRAGIHEIGLPKTVLAARQIFELNPYARIQIFSEGLTEANIEQFLLGDAPLNLLIDECDGLPMKIMLRQHARRLRLPVLMETSDRGMLDIERFDLEPERPLLHGLLETVDPDTLGTLTPDERVALVLDILGAETISARARASMQEIGKTLSTWPQLGSDVILGGATVTMAARLCGLRHPLRSGRYYIDVHEHLSPAPVPAPEATASFTGAQQESERS